MPLLAQVPEPCTCICLAASLRHTSVETSGSASAAAICGWPICTALAVCAQYWEMAAGIGTWRLMQWRLCADQCDFDTDRAPLPYPFGRTAVWLVTCPCALVLTV